MVTGVELTYLEGAQTISISLGHPATTVESGERLLSRDRFGVPVGYYSGKRSRGRSHLTLKVQVNWHPFPRRYRPLLR